VGAGTAAGVGQGILLALPLARLLGALLFQVSPAHSGAIASVAAALIPAFRAANTDPVEAMRGE
jgi:ABC-type lipoprotein release transport system permease subunit